MTGSRVQGPVPTAVLDLTDRFAAVDPWVRWWRRYPDVPGRIDDTMPECDAMSAAFGAFARAAGYIVHVVRVEPDSSDPDVVDLFLPAHVFTVVEVGDDGRWAVDWTARQHWNVVTLAVADNEIPCPLLWSWPAGTAIVYPVPGVPYDGTVTIDDAD